MAVRRSPHRKPSAPRASAAPVEPARLPRESVFAEAGSGAASPWRYAAAIVLLGSLAYSNSLAGPFVLDDYSAIVGNPDIRRVWSVASFLSADGESPLLGRPLVAITFAINYAIGGLNVVGYHVGNIAVHILCALALFGLIRRVRHSTTFAFACASLWMLHPLNTEAVNYLTQRTESMMGLFYFLTLYASVRAHTATRPTPWLAAAVVASVLGMASKQSMVTVPLAVVLVDRVFFFESLPAALRSRWRFYTALAASWLVVAILVWLGPNYHSVGFSTGLSPWTYLLNQSVMITRYLALTVWPRELVADYGHPRALALPDVAPEMAFITALFALTIIALKYRPRLGFPGAWFFLTLALTSSVGPIATEVGAERRMYLPLAALVVLGVSLVAWVSDHASRMRYAPAPRTVAIAGVCAWAVVAASLAAGTVTRNREYSSRLELARLTLDRWPSGKARHGLALELWQIGRREEAFAYLREALRDDSRARFTLGRLLSETGRLREGREHLEEFVRREPLMIEAVEATALIGQALLVDGQLDAAASRFRQVLFMQPSYWNAHLALGDILLAQRKFDDAIAEYRRYFALGGASEGAWINLGTAFARSGRVDEAIQALRRATELYPEAGEAHRNLAAVLLEKGAVSEAVQHARQAVALRPADPLSRGLLGVAFVAERKLDEAINQFREAVRLDPSDAVAQEQLEQALQARELSPGG